MAENISFNNFCDATNCGVGVSIPF